MTPTRRWSGPRTSSCSAVLAPRAEHQQDDQDSAAGCRGRCHRRRTAGMAGSPCGSPRRPAMMREVSDMADSLPVVGSVEQRRQSGQDQPRLQPTPEHRSRTKKIQHVHPDDSGGDAHDQQRRESRPVRTTNVTPPPSHGRPAIRSSHSSAGPAAWRVVEPPLHPRAAPSTSDDRPVPDELADSLAEARPPARAGAPPRESTWVADGGEVDLDVEDRDDRGQDRRRPSVAEDEIHAASPHAAPVRHEVEATEPVGPCAAVSGRGRRR